MRLLHLVPLLAIMAMSLLAAEDVLPAPAPPVSDGHEAAAVEPNVTEQLEAQVARDPTDVEALHALLSVRIAALEKEIRAILERDATMGDLARAPEIDYATIKARAEAVIQNRLAVAEYFEARVRLGDAVDACDAILLDHPGHPAVLAKKLDLLKQLDRAVRQERKGIERELAVRDIEVINEVLAKEVMPRDKPKVARQVMIFDEDVADIERARIHDRLQERVSLENMTNVEVRKVIETLFSISGINYVILDSAIGTETLTLNIIDESLERILAIVARQVDLRYNYIAGTVYISSASSTVLETEIIRLASGLTDVQAQLSIQTGSSGAGGAGGAGGGNPIADPFAAGAQGQGGQQGETKSDLERFLDKIPDILVGWPENGTIYLDRKSNSVFVRATPAAIAEVKRLLAALDYDSVQVLIEARFVLLSEKAGMQLGIDWAGRVQRRVGDSFIGVEGGTNTGGGTVDSPLASPPLPSGMLVSGVLGDINGEFLATSLRALESKGQARALAEPKILTLNNATGLLALENDIAYVESYTTESQQTAANQGTNGNVVTTSSVVLRPQLATEKEEISLKIVPSVARNSDVITLKVIPRVRQLTTLREVPFTYQPSPNSRLIEVKVERPQFDDRKLETVLHVQNGQTIALGGLVKARAEESTTGLPWLSRIPVLGRLFRTDKSGSERSNLVIFVTAHIVEPTGAKVGSEVELLRDQARMALPQSVRDEIVRSAEAEADRRGTATGAQPWQKGRK